MDTTTRPAAPSLQASLRHLSRLAVAGGLALGLLGAAAASAGPVDAAGNGGKVGEVPVITGVTRKVNEYEGQHRRVNEYEGQHRLAGQDPEVPVSPN